MQAPLQPRRDRNLFNQSTLALLAVLAGWCAWNAHALEYPGLAPSNAVVSVSGDSFHLRNRLLDAEWRCEGATVRPAGVSDLCAGARLDLNRAELFRLTLADGRVIAASQMTLLDRPSVTALGSEPAASCLARHFPGQQLRARFTGLDGNLRVEWRATLRDGANSVRQEFVLEAPTGPVGIREVCLMEHPLPGAAVAATVPGSPIVVGTFFVAYEHPDADSRTEPWATARLNFDFAVRPGQPILQSLAIGVTPAGQLRRGFLYYVERERAHPYRPFLHYNAWYDICWGTRKINEAECLDAIEIFGRELVGKRGVPLASFVWDDGWDDPKTLWRPVQTNFPNGFSRILAAARERQSTLGFWLSPFGGYGQPKEDRLAMGRTQGFETGPQGFSLAGPQYWQRFFETCATLIDQDGANFFKFDGLARSVAETDAMLRLTGALRERKPDLFISITTGTWPSPFWLWYGDSIWRGGNDMGFCGPGSRREQWVTYRDRETYRRVVRAAPLYPLNSLMTQGFAEARYGTAAEVGTDPEEIRRDLRAFFASGTCLQELYVTPSMLSSRTWDDLAECVRWAHARSDLLADIHWVGGDPGNDEPYGWAAWSPQGGMLAFRNPAPQPATVTVDIGRAFELPSSAPQGYLLKSPWKEDRSGDSVRVRAGRPHIFPLRPFEVLVFDAAPSAAPQQ